MKKIVFIGALLSSNICQADEWHNALLGVCNQEGNTFKVEYHGKYNEGGEKMVKEIAEKSVTSCNLSDGTYELKPNLFYGASKGMARCSAHEFVEIVILHNGKSIYKSFVQPDCHDSTSYISFVTISPNSSERVSVEFKEGTPY